LKYSDLDAIVCKQTAMSRRGLKWSREYSKLVSARSRSAADCQPEIFSDDGVLGASVIVSASGSSGLAGRFAGIRNCSV